MNKIKELEKEYLDYLEIEKTGRRKPGIITGVILTTLSKPPK